MMVTKEEVMNALRNVIDIEIGENIVDLGLIYDVRVEDEDTVYVKMTLTVPGCPLARFLVGKAIESIKSLGVKNVNIELTFDPPWTPERMSPELRKKFGF